MIIIAPDKFKGTLSAIQAARAIAGGLKAAGADEPMMLCPMADGGDGTAEVLEPMLRGTGSVVESHRCVGPQCFGDTPPQERSSFALGLALREAAERGGTVYAAIGGTACCDGGAGMLQALGMRAFDACGHEITLPLCPQLLPRLARVDFSGICVSPGTITALSDVRAALVPEPGALSALDFARQKGFSASALPELEHSLAHWQRIASRRTSAVDGAGGGIGFALASVLGADFHSGADFILDRYALPFGKARLVVTGEGCIDGQTGGGKVVDAVVRRARAAGVPVLAIGGKVCGSHPFPTLACSAPEEAVPATAAEATRRIVRALARSL